MQRGSAVLLGPGGRRVQVGSESRADGLKKRFPGLLLILLSTIYAVVSATVGTSVIITTEALGARLTIWGIASYGVVIGSDSIILYLSASRLLKEYRNVIGIVQLINRPVAQQPEKVKASRVEVEFSPNEDLIMAAIDRNGGKMLQNALVSATGLSAPTVSRTLLTLENKGLVERKRYGMTNEIIRR